MKMYFIMMVFGMLGISTIALNLAINVIEKQQELIKNITKDVNLYEDCEGDIDYYLRSIELRDNKFILIDDSIALFAARHPHQKIPTTVMFASGYLNVELK